ncbi:bifunctional metallophosphatase/5'-nucleotidase [Sphingomonas segetis]|jgi:5'-nucleotidase|uniref:bifunctional metallophosphatase/5'-nucleotidase n=1 Tax=Sphingomonas segetis TaxID=1104779 RepID=UPI0012D310FB|nr:bifunctional metallophosphatase/5'-nucleotidase [Sphingomonas segetis]
MIRRVSVGFAAIFLSACAAQVPPQAAQPPIEVQILAINDFHGNIETPPQPVSITQADGTVLKARLGGAAQLASALEQARQGHPYSITVAAGDLIGASPLASAYFLDEPTIDAMSLLGLSLASVGNHEFDKGSAELVRMQQGGCEKHTTRVPCRLEPFAGARFQYLAANVQRGDGATLFPATAIKQVGPIKIGFIGETLQGTGSIVSPAGVAGLHFADEAATANALVPKLKAAGADTIVLLIHQGGGVPDSFEEQGCNGIAGDILPILDKLDPAITTVVSGHTHQAYACTLQRGGAARLLTSAGRYGILYTDLRLSFDPVSRRMIGERAVNVPVTGAVGSDSQVAALVARYVIASKPAAERVVGHLEAPATKSEENGESPVADLIADAQLAATKGSNRGNADLSFINSGGVRTDLVPRADGRVTYGQIFALEPFGNTLVVRTLTGAQLKSLLEHQFDAQGLRPSVLVPSANFHFAYDLSKPLGEHIVAMRLDGKPIDPNGRYRVVVNSFLASGGDGYTMLTEGADTFDAGLDLDALEEWLATNPQVPTPGRIRDATPR